MFKIDKVKSMFNCDICKNLLVDPIAFPCGNNICKSHVGQLLENASKEQNSFDCQLCNKHHSVPEDGFVVNKLVQSALELNTLKINVTAFNECKKTIEEANEKVAEIESLAKNPEHFIYEYFEDIKRKLDLRREEVKVKIDEYSDEVIQSIEATRDNCIKLSKEITQITEEIEKSKNDLNDMIKQFDTFEINEKKLESLKQSAAVLNEKCNKLSVDYKAEFFENKEYQFSYDGDLHVSKLFGSFENSKNFKKFSSILKPESINELSQLCDIELDNWSLVYRATRDGFSSRDFHTRCDRIANTITIIKTTNGNVFGGYKEKELHSCSGTLTDPSAFLFSLINKENKPFKVMCSNGGKNAVVCYSHFGPVFGNDDSTNNDIFISSSSNTNLSSYSYLGASYKHPEYEEGTDEAKSILGGSYHFKTAEIEVFSRSFSSTILNKPNLISDLNRLCELQLENWALVYRASRDGFRPEDFHSRCDGITSTLTVIKAKFGNIFGGFTEKAWHSKGGFVTDSKAYVFSLVNKENKPFKIVCSDNGANAICCSGSLGPCFGGDGKSLRDIIIQSDSNMNQESQSDFGCSYKHPDYKYKTAKAQSIIASSFKFQVNDIEVYTISLKS